MDTQKSAEDLEAAGVDSRAAKAHVKMLKEALEDYASVDRIEKIFADLQLDLHKELSMFREGMIKEFSDFRKGITKEFHDFRLQVTWLLVGALLAFVVNLGMAFWKH
jgi:hypothetical protein